MLMAGVRAGMRVELLWSEQPAGRHGLQCMEVYVHAGAGTLTSVREHWADW